MLQLYVAGGRLQVSIVPLSVLDHEDQGTEHAKPVGAVEQADQLVLSLADRERPPTRRARRQQSDCGQTWPIAQAIGLKGTPIFIWRKTRRHGGPH